MIRPCLPESAGPALRLLVQVLVLGLVGALPACLDDTSADAKQLPAGPAGTCEPGRLLAVVGSDFQSSALSFVDLEAMKATSSAIVHSGSVVGAGGGALSGDVVLGSAAPCRPVLVDRARAVLTSILPGDGTAPAIGVQRNVSSGFYANPQDAAAWGDKLVVTRAQAHPDSPKLGGDDVLIVDLADPATRVRVPLGQHSTLPAAPAFGGRVAVANDLAFIPLASVSKTFDKMGSGRVAVVDLPAAAVIATIDRPAKTHIGNCTTARHFAAQDRVVVVCSGLLKAKTMTEGVASAGAVLWLTKDGIKGTATLDSTTRPFGPVACDADRCWTIGLGDGATSKADSVWELKKDGGSDAKGAGKVIYKATGPFMTHSLFFDAKRERLWIADAGHKGGDLVVLSCPRTKPCTTLATVSSNPGGLPATAIEGL